ncbi:MAG: hypothetical protein IT361_09280 [Gemmatimonadaceae bacterium]|nr:hypothetical protein [Gemmatimonadaceae bacterium]
MWHRALPFLVAALLAAAPAAAQEWNDARTRDLVTRATLRRARQLADTALADYTASARGYVTFLAQLGEGFVLPPRVVKADQLDLEIHWKAPNHSRQWIVGRRDTLLLPTDISYHRDHLGIVQNNFPDIIRLGDGDEVQDVPHPLSAPGLATYDFAIGDSLRIEIPGRTIDVYEVKVRPRNDRVPAAVGALYLAKDDAQVVRMAFSFTRVALKDPQLEDVSIILENSLIAERFWLPRRQEIEIRRSGSWMDFPVKGIIRGRWDIRDYTVNAGGTVALSPGPEIQWAPPERRARHRFPPTPILDSLPDGVTIATDDEVRQVQEEARRLVRAQALARARTTRPAARSLSDLAQVNRVEGLAIGAGVRRRLGAGFDLALLGRFGVADERGKGTVSLGRERADGLALRLAAYRDFREAGDVAETSRARNSIAAQEFGADYSQPYGVRGASLSISGHASELWHWSLEGAAEAQRALEVHAVPFQGRYQPTLLVDSAQALRVAFRLERPSAPWYRGSLLSVRAEGRFGHFVPEPREGEVVATNTWRAFVGAELLAPTGRGAMVVRAAVGGVRGDHGVPPQELLLAGGPISAPGYGFHEFRATGLVTARLELRRPVPFVRIPLGRWGQIPPTLTLAPYAGTVGVGGRRGAAEQGMFPYVGLGAIGVFDLLRFDVARGLRDGRWRFAVDVTRDFWSIL